MPNDTASRTTPPRPRPPREVHLAPQASFLADVHAPAAARRYARQWLGTAARDLDPARVDDIVLIVSELVTNAVRYGSEPGDSLLVELRADAELLRVEVRDTVRRHPRLKPESEDRARGRGLFIVEDLGAAWGVEDRPFGKAVWVEVAR